MVIVPLVAWRRRVAVLKWGYVAMARIVAIQYQGTVRRPGEESHGVRNLAGPWSDYETALAQARRFWTSMPPTAPPASFDVARFTLGGMGCFLWVAGMFAVLFMGLWLVLLWLSDNLVARKVEGTLFIVGFTAAYLGVIWLMRRWFMQVKRFAAGALSIGHIGVRPTVRARFIFSTTEGHKTEVEANIDLRPRLESYRTSPEDLVVHLSEDPQRALLLGGTWPPIVIENGEWARQLSPTGSRSG